MLSDYKLFYSKEGVLDSIYDPNGRQLDFDSATKTFNQNDPLVVQLKQLESDTGQSLDLSDRPINPPSLADAIAFKQAEIIAAAYEEQNNLVAGYAPAEQTSWDKKLLEAEAILATSDINDALVLREEAIVFSGATTETDILTATLSLASAIVNKSQELYVASARIAGKRTLLWNQAAAATTVEEVNAIAW